MGETMATVERAGEPEGRSGPGGMGVVAMFPRFAPPPAAMPRFAAPAPLAVVGAVLPMLAE
jgi:hypothetical protein